MARGRELHLPAARDRRRIAARLRSREPTQRLTVTPSVELAGDRWSDITGGGYVRTGDYASLNLQVQYRGGDSWELAAGGTNLADENFELAQGFLEEGRSYYVRARLTF